MLPDPLGSQTTVHYRYNKPLQQQSTHYTCTRVGTTFYVKDNISISFFKHVVVSERYRLLCTQRGESYMVPLSIKDPLKGVGLTVVFLSRWY